MALSYAPLGKSVMQVICVNRVDFSSKNFGQRPPANIPFVLSLSKGALRQAQDERNKSSG